MPLRDAALLLLGHGSTLNADSSAPTYQHAEEIRRRNIFAEVHFGFWKEEPNFRQALRQTSCGLVYVVPNFISSGYFTEQVIPRELGLQGSSTQIGSQEVRYCQPVGLSQTMTGALLKKAAEVVLAAPEGFDPKKACLLICGHGTSLNDNSTKIIHEQAAIIRAKGIYADCQAVLMEQRPFVKDWRTLTDHPNVVVVPFFISDGLHSFEDIPVLLGLTHNMKEKSFTNPHREEGRRLWYATAIGTEASMADVILDQVSQFDADHFENISFNSVRNQDGVFNELMQIVASHPQPWKIGQVVVDIDEESSFRLCHVDDQHALITDLRLLCDFSTVILPKDDPRSLAFATDSPPFISPKPDVRPLESVADLREMILRDSSGGFRPLRAAPNLRRGWVMRTNDFSELRVILDYLYPAAIANWSLWNSNQLSATPWPETAERQSGRFRVVREIDEAGIKELAAQVCDAGCLKRRLWSPASQTVDDPRAEIPLLCPEACNYFVAKAREKLKGPDEE